MGLETAVYIQDLVSTNPLPGDSRSVGDDHIRLIKATNKATFPNATRAQYFKRYSGKTAGFTIASTDMSKVFGSDATASAIAVVLPTLTTTDDGWACEVVKIDSTANAVTIGGTINADTDGFALTKQWQSVILLWSGTAWMAFHPIRMVDGVPTFDSAAVLGAMTIAGLLTLSSTSHFLPPIGTTVQRPVTPDTGSTRYNSTLDALEYADAADNWRVLAHAQPLTFPRNLVVQNNTTTPNSKIDMSADVVYAETSNHIVFRGDNFAVTINAGIVGADGLDASGLANSLYYYGYAIYNPTTNDWRGLLSTSATAPALPSGYTAKQLISTHRTNGSSQLLRTMQKGKWVQYTVKASGTTITLPSLGTTASATLAAIAVAAAVPPIASHLGFIGVTSASVSAFIGSNANTTGNFTTNPSPFMQDNTRPVGLSGTLMLEDTNVYGAVSGGQTLNIFCYNYKLNL